jgi:hypothetical protein
LHAGISERRKVMKKIAARCALFCAVLLIGSAIGAADTAPSANGHWEGKIQVSERDLIIAVDLSRSSAGVWIGSMSLMGTSSLDVPLTGIAVDGTAVRFTADVPTRASFAGSLSADSRSLSGSASNVEGSAPFQLTRIGEANVKVPQPSSLLPKDFEGMWEGALESEGKVKKVSLQMVRTSDGLASATLIAVDSGNLKIPVTTVTIHEGQVKLEIRAISGTYHGRLGSDGEIAGEWLEGGGRLPLTFRRVSNQVVKP